MGSLKYDIRDAARSLLRTPGYTALVILTLGLGIGVNTAVFTIVDALVLKPLPYDEPDRLVRVAEWPESTGGNYTVSRAAYLRMLAEATVRLLDEDLALIEHFD